MSPQKLPRSLFLILCKIDEIVFCYFLFRIIRTATITIITINAPTIANRYPFDKLLPFGSVVGEGVGEIVGDSDWLGVGV